jgi:hypothetical protein
MLCRRLELFSEGSIAIDGSKFKAVKTRDRNFTQAKMQRRLAQIDESIARYLSQLDSADRQGEAVPEAKVIRRRQCYDQTEQGVKSERRPSFSIALPTLMASALQDFSNSTRRRGTHRETLSLP